VRLDTVNEHVFVQCMCAVLAGAEPVEYRKPKFGNKIRVTATTDTDRIARTASSSSGSPRRVEVVRRGPWWSGAPSAARGLE
jgi:hypothetical protein